MRQLRVTPRRELAFGVDGLVRQPVRICSTRCVLTDRLGDEGGLGAEEAEEGHFVDPGLAVDARGGGEEFLSAGHNDRKI